MFTLATISTLAQLREYSKQFATTLKPGVYALVGDLGMGKTTFVQSVGEALGIQKPMTSPTYVIIKEYSEGKFPVVHIDAYRLQSADDALAMGLDEIIADQNKVIFIEWAEKIKELLPANTRWLYFTNKNNERYIEANEVKN